ncbi:MAG TPA: 50S ribosomal protein L16 [Nitrososphaerales archaeon]
MQGKNYRIGSGMATTSKQFLPGTPNIKIARFATGVGRTDYNVKLKLISTEKVQIRHNAIEAARVAANKRISDGVTDYFLEVVLYPHIILRENKMIATAGADRLQEGMRKAYGKPTGLAARVKIGGVIMELSVMNAHLTQAMESLKVAASKLPAPMKIEKTILN